jgi:hypothetical protein
MNRLRTRVNTLAQTLSSGYILMFFSELVFWSRWKADDTLAGYALAWLVYSMLAFVLLWVVETFRARSLPALFLAGAIYGWLDEGVVVQTMYEAFPFQIAWTGLAWHAMLSVLAGWYGLQFALRRGHALGQAAGLGVFWGVWAISWWVETPDEIARLAEFAGYAFGSTALLGLAYWAAGRAWRQPLQPPAQNTFQPGRWLPILIGLLFLAYYLSVTLPAAPQSILILPPLLGLALWALWRNRQVERRPPVFVELAEAEAELLAARGYVSLAAMPLVACMVYGMAGYFQLRLATNLVLAAATTILGTSLFLWSLYRILKE